MKRIAVEVAVTEVEFQPRKKNFLAAIILLAVFAAGCGYKFTGRGESFPRDVRTVFVDPLTNRTKEIGVEREMTTLLKSELTRMGQLKVVDRLDDADAVLTGVIRQFDSRVVGVNRHDEALQYELLLIVDMTLRRRSPDEILWRTQGARFTEVYAGSRASVVTTSPESRALGYNSSDLRRFTDVQLTETTKEQARTRLLGAAAHDLQARLLELF